MKYTRYCIMSAGLWLAGTTAAWAQADGGKTVLLDTATIVAKGKGTSHQLFSFYKTNGAATLEDILSRLPEISLMRRGNYGMEPNIRSLNGGQINVLIDGMVMHGACTDKMDPATIYIEPINLENLQLQTGTQGFAKGSAIGGTLDMKMAEPKYNEENTLHGHVASGYQSVSNGWYHAGVLQFSSGKWALRGSGTFRSNDDYTDGNGDKVHFSGYHKTNFSLSAKYRYNEHTILKADVLTDDGWDIGYAALPMDVGSAKARLASISLSHYNNKSKWYSWDTKLYANAVKHIMDDTRRPDVPMHMDMPGESATAGFYIETANRINARQTLQIRFDGASTFLTASMTMFPPGESPMYMLTWPDNRRNQVGLSGTWQWKPDSINSLRIVARMDAVQSALTSDEAKDYIAITGGNTGNRFDMLKNISLAGSRLLGNGWQLNASAGYAERMPTSSELFGFYLFNAFDGFDYIGNTNLLVENAVNTELSLVRNSQKMKLQLTGFYSHIQNNIIGVIDPSFSAMTIGANGVKVYANLPFANMAGAEASMQWKIKTGLTLVSTVRYTRATGSDGKPLPFIAPLKNIGSLRYAVKRISAQVEYEASMAQKRVNKATGEKTTPGFVLAHARFGYVLPYWKERISLQAGVENMFDVAYREHLDWGAILRPGRNVYAQIKCNF